ncbi:ModD protein [Roseomonas sp. BN140053]|uniref:ModD protein n=1 Tax=Roseomonas sp. BN140053 TaxID=3391898 RepID=UPI0039E8B103
MTFAIAIDRLEAMLREDAPFGDLTTAALGLADTPARAVLRAAGPMTVCCAEEAEALFRLAGCTEVRRLSTSGAQLEAGSTILAAEGAAAPLHAAARVAQALLETASGVATRAARLRTLARQIRAEVALAVAPRHLPGARDVLFKAATAGGCPPLRFGLSDSLLVCALQRGFLGREPPHLWVSRLRAASPGRSLAVEVGGVDEAVQLAHAGVDLLQGTNLSPEQIGEVRRALSGHPRPPLLAATGVDEANIAAFTRAGADLLITVAPFAAPPLPVSITLDRPARRTAEPD